MKKILIVGTLLAVLGIQGCSNSNTNSAASSSSKSGSKALQIAKAGGIRNAKDHKIKEGKSSSSFGENSALYGATFTTVGLINDGVLGGAMNAGAWLTGPASPTSYNRVMMWRDTSNASSIEDAELQLFNELESAITKSLNSSNIPFTKKVQPANRYSSKRTRFQFENSGLSVIILKKGSAKLTNAPAVLGGKKSYFSTRVRIKDTTYKIGHEEDGILTAEIFEKISKLLSSDTYLYMPYNTYSTNAKKVLSYPVVFNQGKANLFITK